MKLIDHPIPDPLLTLRSLLLDHSPSQFERAIASALSGILGTPFRQASAGRQPSGDAGGGAVRLEAKRYRDRPPDTRDLLGGLTSAVTAAPGMTHWVVASTVGLPLQATETLRQAAARERILEVVLDWPTAGAPPLAGALVAGREAVAADFPILAPVLAALAARTDMLAAADAVCRRLLEEAPNRPIHDPSLPCLKDRMTPTAVLDPRFRVVPFMNRDGELEDWIAWARGGNEPARLLTGDGGMGKTRLMIELCLALGPFGCRGGFLREGATAQDREGLIRQLADSRPILVVIDYAERRAEDLAALCALVQEMEVWDRVRLALLARGDGGWRTALCEACAAADLMLGDDSGLSIRRIAPAAPRKAAHAQRDRAALLAEAARAFAAARGIDGDAIATALPGDIDLRRDDFDRILLLHLEAWKVVYGDKGDRKRTPLDSALRWEQRYLAKQATWLQSRTLMETAAWIYMNNGAPTRRAAIDLLTRCPALAGQSADRIERVVEIFHDTYPGPDWLNPIQPDLLGHALMDKHQP
ncbi:hypothetical protein ABMY26_00970 [Azospirillum sp. HJ39]|uniref:hypothetical protein n=1 Tax=Azospirillum sp. HJ39 TaxID=3159496 RepID=UPI0035565B77